MPNATLCTSGFAAMNRTEKLDWMRRVEGYAQQRNGNARVNSELTKDERTDARKHLEQKITALEKLDQYPGSIDIFNQPAWDLWNLDTYRKDLAYLTDIEGQSTGQSLSSGSRQHLMIWELDTGTDGNKATVLTEKDLNLFQINCPVGTAGG